jgi:hypothetical protein
MPLLVSKRREAKKIGVWEVCWTWLPFFLADNHNLHQEVDAEMVRRFSGRRFFEGDDAIVKEMSSTVIDIISEKMPMPGLREALLAIEAIHPELPPLKMVEKGASNAVVG